MSSKLKVLTMSLMDVPNLSICNVLNLAYFFHRSGLSFLTVNLNKIYIDVLILKKTINSYQHATNTHSTTVASIETCPTKHLPYRRLLFIILLDFCDIWTSFKSPAKFLIRWIRAFNTIGSLVLEYYLNQMRILDL